MKEDPQVRPFTPAPAFPGGLPKSGAAGSPPNMVLDPASASLRISADFDGGNIDCRRIAGPGDIELAIRRDRQSDFFQWFYFRLSGARGQTSTLRIINAGEAAYARGWNDYRAVASVDRKNWHRVDTSYEDGVLTIRHTPSVDSVYFAYFAPYSMERHADLIARCLSSERARLTVLGRTLDGQDLDRLIVSGPSPGPLNCWVIGRQHPGETMAEWWIEGFLDRLLDPHDPLARRLLEAATFHVVPNMNPDGSRRGHLRTNAVGTNLNRAWGAPTMDASPEVLLVRDQMEATGVDFCLDVHGDEELPYNFLMSASGIAGYSERLANLYERFSSAYERASPDFQTKHGYPTPRPGQANLSMCTPWVAQRFDCLSMTLEQPFKDNANGPDQMFGWSPARCRLLGRAALDPISQVMNDLR